MELKPGYKQTEVGVIPEEWEVSPLIGKISITHGFAFASQHFSSHGPFRLTTPGHFFEKGGFRDIGDKQKYFIGPVPPEFILEDGDMIVAMTEQADGLLGSAAFIPGNDKYLHNQRLGRVRTLTPEVNPDYLYYIFNSNGFRAKVRETAAGTKVKHTSPAKLLQIPVQIPPAAEQQAIAMTIKRLEALLNWLENLIAKKRGIKQGVMQELLTGKRRLPGFEREWEVKRLGDIAEIDPESIGAGTLPDFHFNYISLEDVEHGNLRSHSEQVFESAPSRARRRLRRNDVLVSTVRPNLLSHLLFSESGGTWVASTGFSVARCKPGIACPGYVFAHLFAEGVNRQIEALLTGSNYPAINSKDVRALEIPLPPYREQCAIAAVLSDIDTELSALEARRDKTRDLKQGMMQELLTGRIRLQ